MMRQTQLDLSADDLEKRVLVITGWKSKEVLPPYSSSTHESRAIRIRRRSRGAIKFKKLAVDFSTNAFARVVEVAGAFAEVCVPAAVVDFARKGSVVVVNPTYVLGYPHSSPTKTVADAFLAELSRYDLDLKFCKPERTFYFAKA